MRTYESFTTLLQVREYGNFVVLKVNICLYCILLREGPKCLKQKITGKGGLLYVSIKCICNLIIGEISISCVVMSARINWKLLIKNVSRVISTSGDINFAPLHGPLTINDCRGEIYKQTHYHQDLIAEICTSRNMSFTPRFNLLSFRVIIIHELRTIKVFVPQVSTDG